MSPSQSVTDFHLTNSHKHEEEIPELGEGASLAEPVVAESQVSKFNDDKSEMDGDATSGKLETEDPSPVRS